MNSRKILSKFVLTPNIGVIRSEAVMSRTYRTHHKEEKYVKKNLGGK
jgi:hypothetical protein